MREFLASFGFVACSLLAAGCSGASTEAKKLEEGAKKVAGEVATEAKYVAHDVSKDAKIVAEKAKLAIIKPVEDELPNIEQKIKGLSGEAATTAKEKFEAFKKQLEEFKSAAPGKWESLKEGMIHDFEALKKLVAGSKSGS